MCARPVVDSLEFARAGGRLNGDVPIGELSRLADSLFDARGGLKYELTGGRDVRQRLRLKLDVAGTIYLKCQRCLGSLTFPVAVKADLLVLSGQAGGETADLDDLDGVPASAQTDVWSLVEDEILLALPFAPRHAEELCSPSSQVSGNRGISPFSALATFGRERIKD